MSKRISYTQVSMFTQCPHRWKTNYVDKVSKREGSIHLIFGTAMHEVLLVQTNNSAPSGKGDMNGMGTLARPRFRARQQGPKAGASPPQNAVSRECHGSVIRGDQRSSRTDHLLFHHRLCGHHGDRRQYHGGRYHDRARRGLRHVR